MFRNGVGGWAVYASVACLTLLIGGALIAERASVTRCDPKRGCLDANTYDVYRQKFSIRLSKSSAGQGGARRPQDFAARDGSVVWTLGNYSWLDFVLNWVASAEKAGVESYFVGCLDDQLLDELVRRGVHAVKVGGSLGGEELVWGSDDFRERGKQKIRFIRSMVESGLQPLFLDLDAVLLGDPLPLLRMLPDADILISSDHIHPGDVIHGLEACPVPGMEGYFMGFMNVGMHLMRKGAVPVLQAWEQAMGESKRQEQQVFNDVINVGVRSVATPSRWAPYCRAGNDSVTVGLLAPTLFANGHLYFNQGLPDWTHAPLPALAMHANFIPGRDAKRHHMRDSRLWHVDEPVRFSPPGGFLSFQVPLSVELLQAVVLPRGLYGGNLTEQDLHGHVDLLEHQLSQLRAAMQLSLALGRQLVLPQLWCGPDPSWDQHHGFTPPNDTHNTAMPCPLGAVIDIPKWIGRAKEGQLPVFHEPALLAHPLMQNKSRLVVRAAGEQLPNLPTSLEQPMPSPKGGSCLDQWSGCELSVPGNQTLTELTHVLKAAASVDVLQVRNIAALLEEPGRDAYAAFTAAVEGLVLQHAVCCVGGDQPLPVSF